LDTRKAALNVSTIAELRALGVRAAIFTSDWGEFTGRSPLAMDACTHIDIWDPPTGVMDEPLTAKRVLGLLGNGTAHAKVDLEANRWWQMFMSTSTPTVQIETMAIAMAEPDGHGELDRICAASFHIPGLTSWCPAALLDIVALNNYYLQLLLEHALKNRLRFPHTMYLGGITEDGCLPTGVRGTQSTKYAFTGTVLLSTVDRLCASRSLQEQSAACATARKELQVLRAKCPPKFWHDPTHGRLENWPPLPLP
jgi:hypothetical protein